MTMPEQEQPRELRSFHLSKDLRKIIDASKAVAKEYNSSFIEPPHIFLTLLRLQRDAEIRPIILGKYVRLESIIASTESLIHREPNIADQTREPELSRRSRTVLIFAEAEAKNEGEDEIRTTDMVRGIIREEKGPVATVLSMYYGTAPEPFYN